MAEAWSAIEEVGSSAARSAAPATPPATRGAWDWSDLGAGTYASGAGTALAFVGQMVAAGQAKKAADYNAKVADRNAQAAATAAQIEAQQHLRNASMVAHDLFLVRQSQEWDEEQQRQQQEYVAGQTQAIIGASGLLLRGSPLMNYEFNLRQSQRQILARRYQADLQERALRDQQTMQQYAAAVSEYGAGERLRVGRMQGALAQYTGSQQAAAARTGALGSLGPGVLRTVELEERRRAIQQGGVS